MYLIVALFGLIAIGYAGYSARVDNSNLTGPIIFLVLGAVLGPSMVGLLAVDLTAETIKVVAEITLALVLFMDAMKTDGKFLKATRRIPIRLLLVGMPLTILLGALIGMWLFPEFPVIEAAILATVLAPTDAALGKAVVEDERIPIGVRTGLNVESGLNDGLAVPILFVLLALRIQSVEAQPLALTLEFLVKEIGIGAVVGVAVTYLSHLLFVHTVRRGWISDAWMQIPVVALAVAIYCLAQYLGGSGFIGAFVGGLVMARIAPEHSDHFLEAATGISEMLSMITWVIFGALIVPSLLTGETWITLAYAVLSLTVVRMLPVLLSLIGTKMDFTSQIFIAWFGPRGLASIVFAVIIMGRGLVYESDLLRVIVTTVTLSVFAHGASSTYMAGRMGPRMSPLGAK